MQDNDDVKDKIQAYLDESNNTDALNMFKEYAIAYRSNEKNSRNLTVKQAAALLSVSLRNTSNKIIVQKLNSIIDELQSVSKM